MFCLEVQLRLLLKGHHVVTLESHALLVSVNDLGMWEKIVQMTPTVILLCKHKHSSSSSTEHISEVLCSCVFLKQDAQHVQVPNTSKNWDCN